MDNDLINTTERVASIVWALAEGQAITTREVADRTGLSIRGAQTMMAKVTAVVPITAVQGHWVRMDLAVALVDDTAVSISPY